MKNRWLVAIAILPLVGAADIAVSANIAKLLR
jgi:hypothetical protein